MKRALIGIGTVVILAVLSSCSLDEDGYSATDMWINLGIYYEDDTGGMGCIIHLDDGMRLVPVASDTYFGHYEDSSRVLVNYTILGDITEEGEKRGYYVKVNSMRKILMKGILDLTADNEDSIGNDPIIVRDAWLSGNLLNFELKYWGGNAIHSINLVKQPGDLALEQQPVELELRHNDNGDTGLLPFAAFVSFDLSALKREGRDSTCFRVTVFDYDGILYSEEGVYHYGNH
jgi:hypothetical protein